jgi:mevalonate kinase
MLNNSKIKWNEKIDKAGKSLFIEEINRTKQTLKSVDARAHIFEDIDNENLKDIYEKLKQQIYTNAEYITKYIDAYDYVMKPVTQKEKIKELIKQNEMLISKLNILVEQMISVDKSVNDLDTTYVDDIIDALKTVSETQVLENKYR